MGDPPRLCAGCGKPSCDCTPEDVRLQLERDRAELSARAASYTALLNDAARLLRQGMNLAAYAEDVPSRAAEARRFAEEVDAWLTPSRAAPDVAG